jgi:hypothetical protein
LMIVTSGGLFRESGSARPLYGSSMIAECLAHPAQPMVIRAWASVNELVGRCSGGFQPPWPEIGQPAITAAASHRYECLHR